MWSSDKCYFLRLWPAAKLSMEIQYSLLLKNISGAQEGYNRPGFT